MSLASRLGRVPISLFVVAACALPACHKNKADKPKVVAASPAEIKRLADAAKKSLEELKAPLTDLNGKFSALHEQFDKLPADLPQFGETRSRFYTAFISVGTLSAKVPWLAGRIDSAVKSADRAELDEISKDITHTREEIRQADQVSIELLHRVMPFKRVAEEIRARGGKCE